MFGNWLKTTVLMAAIVALFGAIGGYLGGANGMIMALIFGGAMNFFAYWFSDSMVLKMYNALIASNRGKAVWYINQDLEIVLMQLLMQVGSVSSTGASAVDFSHPSSLTD